MTIDFNILKRIRINELTKMRKVIFMAGEIVSVIFFCISVAKHIAIVMNTPTNETPDGSAAIAMIVGFVSFCVIVLADKLTEDKK